MVDLKLDLQHFCLQGRPIDFTGVDESISTWVQDFSLKSYATPAKLESIDGGDANVDDLMDF